jgi:uncharacterized membrane protein YccF (DUF307 family)
MPQTLQSSRQVRAASGLMVLLGFWLVMAPWILGYSEISVAVWNSLLIGIAVATLALIRIALPLRSELVSWITFLLGIWFVLSPFLLGFGEQMAPMWNNIIIGLLILTLASWAATTSRSDTTV